MVNQVLMQSICVWATCAMATMQDELTLAAAGIAVRSRRGDHACRYFRGVASSEHAQQPHAISTIYGDGICLPENAACCKAP
jgi:hypothetical protein